MAEMGGMTTLLLLLCVGATVGRGVDLQKRIIGGHDCGPTERLHHAKLVNYMDIFFCGGTLISDQWILTAAHCLQWLMFAYVGRRDIAAQPIKVIDYRIFSESNGNLHDIMLLKLASVQTVTPAKLPDCKNSPISRGHSVQIAGYAATQVLPGDKKGTDRPPNLQCADTEVVDSATLPSYERALFSPTVDACQGDSGGGVLRKSDLTLHGVIVRGDAENCYKKVTVTDVCAHINWINNEIKP